MNLTDRDKQIIKDYIDRNEPLPAIYKSKLFDSDDIEFVEATKDYKLTYKGKARKENIIARTPAAPFQKNRSFNTDNPFEDNWRNMLIFGDNLLALKTLYNDQRGGNTYKTKNRIKLIYIDPPFATKQDFMKDREKAYRDKVIGAQFIEFLRKRLILLQEILADDGSIYVHLDWKKGHYIKAILDEVFGEHNFLNNVVWCYKTRQFSKRYWNRKHHDILVYSKDKSNYIFNWDDKNVLEPYSKATLKKYKLKDENGYYRLCGRGIVDSPIRSAKDVNPKWEKTHPELVVRDYLGDGFAPNDYWNIEIVNQAANERENYPTQKPEQVLAKVISASSNEENDIVLDAFAGSGTTLAVAEKLNRRWIGIDCGKLSIYTVQKRLLNLTTQIGPAQKEERRDYERVEGFREHSKNSRGLFFIYEKARRGDFVITDTFLKNLARVISENLQGNSNELFSLICPKDKFKIDKLKVTDNEDGNAGDKIVTVNEVKFLISFISPKEKTEKEKPLKAKEFALYYAGIYDNKQILKLDWGNYKPFVAQLFGVRTEPHKIYGFTVDGYIGTNSVYIWPYPEHKKLILDRDYVDTLHRVLGGRAGEKLYVIAPVTSMAFMEDEVKIGKTTYVFLKVPLSVLMALIEKGEPGSLKQPVSEADVNEVIDAIGFDFISQPVVQAKYTRAKPQEQNLLNQKQKDYVIKISNFKSNTLVYDPQDFNNFETLSMVMVDLNYNGDYFNLDKVFWSDQILNENRSEATIRIPQDEFTGKQAMVIFMDKYGNELKIVKSKKDFK